MIFLVDYDRKKGLIRLFKAFKAEQRAEAQRARDARWLARVLGGGP